MTVILTTASTGTPVGMGTWELVANLTLFQLGGGAQYDKEADFKSNISLHLRVSYYNNIFYTFL